MTLLANVASQTGNARHLDCLLVRMNDTHCGTYTYVLWYKFHDDNKAFQIHTNTQAIVFNLQDQYYLVYILSEIANSTLDVLEGVQL